MTWRYDTHPSFASRSQLGQATLGLFVASPVAASVSVPMHCAPAPTAGHGAWSMEGAVGSGRSGWARKQEIPGGWLVLAYIPLLGVPFQTSQTRRATWRHSVGFGDDHGPQPGPRAHEKGPRGTRSKDLGGGGVATYFQVEVPSAPSHCRPVRKVKNDASLCAGADIHTLRNDQPIQRTMRPRRTKRFPVGWELGLPNCPWCRNGSKTWEQSRLS
jgi:hypothetical protein